MRFKNIFYSLLGAFLVLIGTCVIGSAAQDLPRSSQKRSSRLIVTFKSTSLDQMEKSLPPGPVSITEAQKNPDMKTFFTTHRLRTLRPLYADHVAMRRSTGKKGDPLAAQIRKKFPTRAARHAGRFNPPDLSRSYVVIVDSSDAVIDATLASLKKDPRVESVYRENQYSATLTPNDFYYNTSTGSWGQTYPDLWGQKKIQAGAAWDRSTGTGVLVAVVDSGIDYTHPDLIGNVWTDSISGTHGINILTGAFDPRDDYGHGTHCAGIIAARGNNSIGVIGVAWQSQIVGVKAIDNTGNGWSSDLAQGIVWATALGAQVINMSWGYQGETDPTLDIALSYAYNHGVILVAAAGNSAMDASLFYPANSPYVITVSASDASDHLANFSNFGSRIDVAAPGVDILSLQAAGTNDPGGSVVSPGYIRLNGTSMAAPFVTGLSADLLALHPGYTHEQIRTALKISADDIGQPGFDTSFGYGRINAARTLAQQSGLVARILSPGSNVSISSPTPVIGSAGAAANFSHYVLEYSTSTNNSNWSILANVSSSQVSQATLAVFNPALVPDGRCTLRLTVYDTFGSTATDQVTLGIHVNNISQPVPPATTDGATIYKPGAAISIRGTTSVSPFSSYRIEWAQGVNPSTGWVTSGIQLANAGTLPVSNGLLGTWTTPSGAGENYYTLRLLVDGGSFTSTAKTLVFLQPALANGTWPRVLTGSRVLYASPYPIMDADGTVSLSLAGKTNFWVVRPDGSLRADVLLPLSQTWNTSNPVVGHIDGTLQEKAIIGGDRTMHAITPDGAVSNLYTDSTLMASFSNPVTSDLEGDGQLETLFLLDPGTSGNAALHAVHADGTELTGNFPLVIQDQNSQQMVNGNRILAVDLNRDGRQEILVVHGNTSNGVTLKAYNWNGTAYPWPVVSYPGKIIQFLGAADLDNNGQVEVIVITTDQIISGLHTCHVLNASGVERTGWPVNIIPAFNYIPFVAIGDLDRDGKPEIVISAGSLLHVLRPNGQPYSSAWPHDEGINHSFGPVVIGDADGDSFPDIIVDKEDHVADLWGTGTQPSYEDFRAVVYRRDGAVLKSFRINGTQGMSHIFMQSFALGDFQKDGKLKLAIADQVWDAALSDYRAVLQMYDLGVAYNASATPWPMQYRDAQNSASIVAHVSPVNDATPPTIPANVVFSSQTLSSFRLSWSPSTDNIAVKGYRVDLSTDSSFTPFYTVDVGTVTAIPFSGLPSHFTLFARVRAYDGAQNVSANSPVVSGQTLGDSVVPSTPKNVAFSNITASSMKLSWSASTDNIAVTGYRVEFATSAAFNPPLPVDVGNVTSVPLNGLISQFPLYARVRAYDAAQNVSSASLVAFGKTTGPDITPPSIPANVVFSSITASSLQLSWSPSTDNVAVTGYQVDLATNSSFTPAFTFNVGNILGFPLNGLPSQFSLYARVRAYDAAAKVSGNSAAAHGVTLGGASSTPFTGFNVPLPTNVTLMEPGSGAHVTGTVNVSASSATSALNGVEFYVDGHLRATATSIPYQFSWDTRQDSEGQHVIQAKAVGAGTNGASASRVVFVSNGSASSSVARAASDLSAVRVYPNPWRSNRHANNDIIFDQLPSGSTIKLFTVSGHWIKTLSASGTSISWNLTNDSGDKVASGLYLYLITTGDNQKKTGQLAIIR